MSANLAETRLASTDTLLYRKRCAIMEEMSVHCCRRTLTQPRLGRLYDW